MFGAHLGCSALLETCKNGWCPCTFLLEIRVANSSISPGHLLIVFWPTSAAPPQSSRHSPQSPPCKERGCFDWSRKSCWWSPGPWLSHGASRLCQDLLLISPSSLSFSACCFSGKIFLGSGLGCFGGGGGGAGVATSFLLQAHCPHCLRRTLGVQQS